MRKKIRLLKGSKRLTMSELKDFKRGDTIYGLDSNPEELDHWDIEDKANALEELKKYKCSYVNSYNLHDIEEYALEYFVVDEDGKFLSGSDFELAEENVSNQE